MLPRFHNAHANTFHPEISWVLGFLLLPSFILDKFSEAHHIYDQNFGKVNIPQVRVLGVKLFICFNWCSHHYKVYCLELSSDAENHAEGFKRKSAGMG